MPNFSKIYSNPNSNKYRQVYNDRYSNFARIGNATRADMLAQTERAKAQAEDIWENEVLPKLHRGEKVGLLYAANNDQATDLHRVNENGQRPDGLIDGGGQALIFKALADKIAENHLENRVHILPIATSMRGGDNSPKNGNNHVDLAMINRDLQSVADHKAQGFEIMGLANGDRYAIGGGFSKHWGNTPEHLIQVHPEEDGTFTQSTSTKKRKQVPNSITQDDYLQAQLKHIEDLTPEECAQYQPPQVKNNSIPASKLNKNENVNRAVSVENTTGPAAPITPSFLKRIKNFLTEWFHNRKKSTPGRSEVFESRNDPNQSFTIEPGKASTKVQNGSVELFAAMLKSMKENNPGKTLTIYANLTDFDNLLEAVIMNGLEDQVTFIHSLEKGKTARELMAQKNMDIGRLLDDQERLASPSPKQQDGKPHSIEIAGKVPLSVKDAQKIDLSDGWQHGGVDRNGVLTIFHEEISRGSFEIKGTKITSNSPVTPELLKAMATTYRQLNHEPKDISVSINSKNNTTQSIKSLSNLLVGTELDNAKLNVNGVELGTAKQQSGRVSQGEQSQASPDDSDTPRLR